MRCCQGLDPTCDGAAECDRRLSEPCECDSHSGLDDGLWQCDECGEVVRYVDDPAGNVTLTELHPYRNRRVRVEVVSPGHRVRWSGTLAPKGGTS